MENVSDKKNKVILVVILIILILGFLGFISYNKFLLNKNLDSNNSDILENNNEDNNFPNEESNQNKDQIIIKSINEFPKISDDTAITYGKFEDLVPETDLNKISLQNNFKDINISIGGIDLIFNCTNFSNECNQASISFNNKTLYEYDIDILYPYIIVTNKYIILSTLNANTGVMFIYDYNGDKIFEEGIVNSYKTNDDSDEIITLPTVTDNILYFIKEASENHLSLNYINLLDDEIINKEIENFEGYLEQY